MIIPRTPARTHPDGHRGGDIEVRCRATTDQIRDSMHPDANVIDYRFMALNRLTTLTIAQSKTFHQGQNSSSGQAPKMPDGVSAAFSDGLITKTASGETLD